MPVNLPAQPQRRSGDDIWIGGNTDTVVKDTIDLTDVS